MSDNSVGQTTMDKATMSDKSMSDKSMSDKAMPTAVSSMKSIGRVNDSSDGSSEGLGLGGGPVLSLEGLGHRLVGDLSCTTANKTMSTNKAVSH